MIEDEEGPFSRGGFKFDEIRAALRMKDYSFGNEGVREILESQGFEKVRAEKLIGGKRYTAVIWTKDEQALSMGPAEQYDWYVKNANGGGRAVP